MNRTSFEAQSDHFRKNFAIFAGPPSRSTPVRQSPLQSLREQRRKETLSFYNLYYMGFRTP